MAKIAGLTVSKTIATMNREAWLTSLAKSLEPLYHGYKLGEYRLTCGWPSKNALARSNRRIGECHGLGKGNRERCEIFISPLLADPLEVAGTVCHELAHVAAGVEAKHGKEFIKVCRLVGLTKGKPACIMPGDQLRGKLKAITEYLGEYPHKGLPDPPGRQSNEQLTNLTSAKLLCSECGCTFRLAIKWLAESGMPTCGCGNVMEVYSA